MTMDMVLVKPPFEHTYAHKKHNASKGAEATPRTTYDQYIMYRGFEFEMFSFNSLGGPE